MEWKRPSSSQYEAMLGVDGARLADFHGGTLCVGAMMHSY